MLKNIRVKSVSLLFGIAVLFLSLSQIATTSFAAPSCSFSVHANGSGPYSLNGFKFWAGLPSAYYEVSISVSDAPGNYAVYLVKPTGDTILFLSNQSLSSIKEYFAADSGLYSGGGYKFRVTPQGVPGTTWGESNSFYQGVLPDLTVTTSPTPMVIGEQATVNWTVSGGLAGLVNGGWTGDIRLQWYQNSTPLSNLDQILVSDGSYSFTVPNSIIGGTVPGVNFRIAGVNADTGTSIPSGMVSDFSGYFDINSQQPDIGINQSLVIAPIRTNPSTIYSLPELSEYGGIAPFESEKNIKASFQIVNNGDSSVTIEDWGVLVKSGVSTDFRITSGSGFNLSSGGVSGLFDKRGYITDDQLSSGGITTFTGQVQVKIDGTWIDATGSGSGTTFTVYPRPSLTNGMLIKRPRSKLSTDPNDAKVYFYQNGIKWDGAGIAYDGLVPDWETEYYVYPGAAIAGLAAPSTPNTNSVIPIITGRNLLYKLEGNADVYIIEPEPCDSSLVSRKFENEDAFYSYGYSNTILNNEPVELDLSQISWIQSQYPVGTTITSGTNAPYFDPAPTLPSTVVIPGSINFLTGVVIDNNGLASIRMDVTRPDGQTVEAFTDNELNGQTSKDLTVYWFGSNVFYSGVVGSYNVKLTVTGTSGQSVSETFPVTIESIQTCGTLKVNAFLGSEIWGPDFDNINNQYRYGPSIILNGNTVHMWASSEGPGYPMDLARYNKGEINDDGTIVWEFEAGDWKSALEATPNSPDQCSVCDPSVFYFKDQIYNDDDHYYYIGYTSTANCAGGGKTGNQVFVARCIGLPDGNGNCVKWNGSGWGGNPWPFIEYNGDTWGKGQPSFVVKDNLLYIYYTDNGTKVVTVDATSENWPALVDETKAITIFTNDSATDEFGGKPGPFEVKFIDDLQLFIGTVVVNEFNPESNIVVFESKDGLHFTPVATSKNNWISAPIQVRAHNIGISGDKEGHLNRNLLNFIAYGFGVLSDARWPTYLNRIEVGLTEENCQPGEITLEKLNALFSFDWDLFDRESIYSIIQNCISDPEYTYTIWNPWPIQVIKPQTNAWIRGNHSTTNNPIGIINGQQLITPYLDSVWGNNISADDSFNTVYEGIPEAAEKFEVISHIDQFSPFDGTTNDKCYFFTYDTKNDANGDAVTLLEWIDYLKAVTVTYGRPIDTLTIFAHGFPGSINMSDCFKLKDDLATRLGIERLKNENILANDATILLFSCDVGKGSTGEAFIQNLADWSGATVYASSNLTGPYVKKDNLIARDWDLDVVKLPTDPGTSQAPLAVAESPDSVLINTLVTLDGTKSTDADDGIVSYFWEQLSGTTVSLSNANSIQPVFTAPAVSQDEILTFQFTVTDHSGLQSTDTSTITITTGDTLPSPPTGVSVCYQSSIEWNYLTWNHVSDAVKYKVYWSTSPGVTVASNVMSETMTTDYGHTGVASGSCYYYRVSAVNSAGGESGLSSEAFVCLPAAIPDTPTGISAIYQESSNRNYITWNRSNNATGYKVYWGTSPGVTTTSNVMPETATIDYGHTGVENGSCYYYRVSAVNSVGESGLSAEASVCLSASVPDIPTGVTAIYQSSSGRNYITWDPSANATGYKVYWGTSPGVTSGSNVMPETVTTDFGHTDVESGSCYYYRVSAVNSEGESGLSAEVSVCLPAALPYVPTGINALYQSSSNRNYITWSPSANTTGYKVYWRTSSGVTETSIVMPETVTTDCVHTGVESGTCYYYRVSAINSAGESGLSAEVSACLNSSSSFGKWEWQNPLPQGNALNAIWGTSDSDVFAVGNSGTIIHYDGTSWTIMGSGTTVNLNGVWGSSKNDVFAVGSSGTILHYDGSTWTPMSCGTTDTLNGIWGSSESDVFAVSSGGMILHYNGSVWTEMLSETTVWLEDVWGSSGNDVFAVGCGIILHYNGSSWTEIENATNFLYGVWGSSSSDVFAVGDMGAILHYDGSTWTKMEGVPYIYFQDVWGSSGNDVFAIGGNAILHYDGDFWTEMSSGTTAYPGAVWGSSDNDVFAVGGSGAILHYDGNSWAEMSSGTNSGFGDVWGSSGSDVFAVGGTILHYDGNSWAEMSSGTNSGFGDVWGSSGSDVFAVGGGGTILHYDGNSWTEMSSGTPQWLNAVWGSSESDVFAVGNGGTILHYNGNAWTKIEDTPYTYFLNDIWGSSESDVFVVGGSGTILEDDPILHYDGNSWTEMSSGATDTLNGIWGSSGSDVFAVGESGTILHYDGSIWATMTSGTTNGLWGIWGTSGSDIFAVGNNGTILHYVGPLADSDNDGLADDLENTMCTDPNDADTDDDGISDGIEDANHNGVVDTDETDPCNIDTDSDGMPDGWEKNNGMDPLNNLDALEDADNDGYSTLQEYKSGTDPQNLTSKPQPPAADAGPDQTVTEGDLVTLGGCNSSDIDDGIIGYLWTQTSGPSVTLSDVTAVMPTFVAPAIDTSATLTFQLQVEDNGSLKDTDEISVVIMGSSAVAFEINQLTDNSVNDIYPSAYNGNIAWYNYESGGSIYYWDKTSVTQVTSNDNTPADAPFSLYDGTIAWYAWDGNIYYWNGTSTIQAINSGWPPSLYNRSIAWSGHDGNDWEIYYWDGNSITQITDNDIDDSSPSLYGSTISWHAWDGNDTEIYYWDGNTITQITNNDISDDSPSLHDGSIAWRGHDGIYYWNGTSTVKISNSGNNPSLYNGTIAWAASDGNDNEIYFWNGTSVIKVTDNNLDDIVPSNHNGIIVWQASDGNDYEIYYTFTTLAPALQALFAANLTGDGNTPLTISFTDQSTGNVTSWEWDFDNDGTVDSTLEDPTHTYTTPGLYTVSFTASGNEGSKTLVRDVLVYTNSFGMEITPDLGGVSSFFKKIKVSPDFEVDHTVYALSSKGVLYKSSNSGDSWNILPLPAITFVEDFFSSRLNSVRISPEFKNDHTIFLSSFDDPIIYKTSNDGQNWEALSSIDPTVSGIESLSVSPDFINDSTIMVGVLKGGADAPVLYKSTDGGVTWHGISDGVSHYMDIKSLWFSPDYKNDGIIYASSLKSNNRGDSFSSMPFSPYTPWFDFQDCLAISPNFASDNTLFLAVAGMGEDGWIYKSNNAGDTWTSLMDVSWPGPIHISPDYSNDRTLFCSITIPDPAYSKKFLQTNNDGASWSEVLPDSGIKVEGIAIPANYSDTGMVFLGTDSGIVRLIDLTKFIEKGDIDGNRSINLADAILSAQVTIGLNPEGINLNADVNGDGKIGLEEVIYILQKVSGLR